jgi:hypothetical protein
MEHEEKKKLVLESTVEVDGRMTLPCEKALRMSQENDISLKEIGEICDAENVKITSCQLGCFR